MSPARRATRARSGPPGTGSGGPAREVPLSPRQRRILPLVRVADATTLLACDVFQRADRAHVRITPALVEQRLTELRGHRPGCNRRLHEAAAKVRRPLDVYFEAVGWPRVAAATRARAGR